MENVEVHYRIQGHAEDPRFVASFSWSETDPAAVKVHFGTPNPDEDVDWIFSRELLADGITSHKLTGLGDVKLRLARGFPGDPERFHVNLHSPEGTVDLYMPTAPIRDFLARTESALPPAIFEGDPEEKKIIGELDFAIEAILAKAESEGE